MNISLKEMSTDEIFGAIHAQDPTQKNLIETFNSQKHTFFVNYLLPLRGLLSLHHGAGLTKERDVSKPVPHPKKSEQTVIKQIGWSNVLGHCILESCRAKILGEMCQMSADTVHTLQIAALLHDFDKKGEIVGVNTFASIHPEKGKNREAFATVGAELDTQYTDTVKKSIIQYNTNKQKNITYEDIKYLKGATSHTSITEGNRILDRLEQNESKVTELELSYLMLLYIDNISINDRRIEDIDQEGNNQMVRRMQTNKNNSGYATLNEEGQEHYGENTFDALEKICKKIENFLATKTDNIQAESLPVTIEKKLIEMIKNHTN